MKLQYFDTDASDRDVIEALGRDGACVVLNQAPAETIDAVNADFRAVPWAPGKIRTARGWNSEGSAAG